MSYTQAFEDAVNHAMLYEVGGSWDLDAPGTREGLIDTEEHRKNCGYVNDPDDAGGETKYGVAKNANPDVDISNLDWEGAKAIYYDHYWLAGHCDLLNSRVAVLHFDGCVNHGIGRANTFLQKAVGVDADGVIGKITIAAVNADDPFYLCNLICDQRAKFYQDIVNAKPSQAKYLRGWLRRINEMRVFTTNPTKAF